MKIEVLGCGNMQSQLIYELRQPTHLVPNKKYPAIFLMHGMGSNEQDLLPLVKDFKENSIIFSIRGPIAQPPGYAFFTIEGFGKPHRTVFDGIINELTDFIDEACEAYPVDQDNMFLLGFSQGAILPMTLGLSLGSRVKGVAALSGYIPDFVKREYTIQDVQNVSFFISHGETDHVLPFEWGKENASFLQEQGASVTFQHYPVGHTVYLQNFHDLVNWMKNHIM